MTILKKVISLLLCMLIYLYGPMPLVYGISRLSMDQQALQQPVTSVSATELTSTKTSTSAIEATQNFLTGSIALSTNTSTSYSTQTSTSTFNSTSTASSTSTNTGTSTLTPANPTAEKMKFDTTPVVTTLRSFYGGDYVPQNIRIERNPKNSYEINVFISELQNGILKDAGKIVIMTYGGQYHISQVVDLKTGTQAQFNYAEGYVLSSIWRTSCSDISCRGGYWRSQINQIVIDPKTGNGTANITSVLSPSWLLWSDAQTVRFTNLADLLKQSTDRDISAATANILSSFKNSIGSLTFHYSYTSTGYKVVVANAAAVTGGLSRMEFVVKRDGTIDPTTLQAIYRGATTNLIPNGPLLFAGMKLLQSGISDINALVLMNQIGVTKVESASSIYLLYQNRYYKIYTEANQTKKMQMVNLQGVYLPYDALFAGLRLEDPLTQITAAQFQESLEATVQYENLVAQAYAFMTDPVNHILPTGTSFPVLFLKGINLSPETLNQFAMSPEVYDIVIVPLEPFLVLPQDSITRRNWIVPRVAHEAMHLVDVAADPNIAILISEAHAYEATAQAARVLGAPAEQIAKQEKIAAAFSVLSSNPQVVAQIFNTTAQNFKYIGYESIQLPGGSVVRIDLSWNGQHKIVDVDVSAPAGSQISVIQNDASGRLSLRTQCGTGAVLWTQQYSYTGTSTTPDYSKRTYGNGNVEYYNSEGGLFLERTASGISQIAYDDMKQRYSFGNWAIDRVHFLDAGYTVHQTAFLDAMIARAFQAGPASEVLKVLSNVRHIIFVDMPPGIGGGGNPDDRILLLNNYDVEEWSGSTDPAERKMLIDVAVMDAMHEVGHAIDFYDHCPADWKTNFTCAMESERNQYAGSAVWAGRLGLPQDWINWDSYISDHVRDNNYSNPIVAMFQNLTTADTSDQAMAPLMAAEEFIHKNFGETDWKYISSPIETRDQFGTTLSGYSFSFQRADMRILIFVDLSGEWIYYNGQWSPNAELIAMRLLDRTSISPVQYQSMIELNLKFFEQKNLPETYEAFQAEAISAEVSQLERVLDRIHQLDPHYFVEMLGALDHVIFTSFEPWNHGAMVYPQIHTVVLNELTYATAAPEEKDRIVLTGLVHEVTHISDLEPYPDPTLYQLRVSEARAYAAFGYWNRLLGYIAESNVYQFIADHIPDHDYDGIMARAITSEPALNQQAMAPLENVSAFLRMNVASLDWKYVSSPVATMTKSTTVFNGYTFTFQKPDQTTVSVFVDLSGEWIYYNGQWYQGLHG